MKSARDTLRKATRLGHVLAFVAALLLSLDLHQVHAHADSDGGHGHSGMICEALDIDSWQPDDEGGKTLSHGDCVHHFYPLFRAVVSHSVPYVHLALTPPRFDPVRQETVTFDPPPPRPLA